MAKEQKEKKRQRRVKQGGPSPKRSFPRPVKRLGQHFLKDAGLIHQIVERAGFSREDRVVEIGPGRGALTLPLARTVGEVYAVEKDPRLAEILREELRLSGLFNVFLIRGDILRLEFRDILPPPVRGIKIIGNLPYNISSPFLEKITRDRTSIDRAILMFQLEFARRLTASPGGKDYGAMSIMVQYHAGVSPVISVPREAFFPKPKVDALVLELDFKRPHPRRAEDDRMLQKVVKGAFAHRRKTLFNALRIGLPDQEASLLNSFSICGIEPVSRAETLEIDDFICLASALKSVDKRASR